MIWLACLLCFYAAWHDLRTREIPDWIPLVLTAGSLAVEISAGETARWGAWMSGTAMGIGAGLLLALLLKFGGGDAKLIASLGGWTGPAGLLAVLLWTAIAGMFFCILCLLRGQKDLAYGPAIASGLTLYLLFPTWL